MAEYEYSAVKLILITTVNMTQFGKKETVNNSKTAFSSSLA
jgi:hypothetical protein